MPDFVIETHDLTKRFGAVTAVDRLSLEVPQGGVFGLLGPNGSGKTTTMGMLLDLIAPTSGMIKLFGEDITASHEKALRRIGAIVETPAFYPYLSGRANLRYFQGVVGPGNPKEVDDLLEVVGLAARADSKFSTYSLGMKQRLGVAYAMLGDRELLFLDEPTNGLDPAGMAEVRALVRKLAVGGRTVLLSSHLLYEVEQVCDHVAILAKGRLIANGRVHDLLRQQGVVSLDTTDNDVAEGILRELDWVTQVRREPAHLVVTAPPERSWELTAALAARQIYVKAMSAVQESLEEYFLQVTGEERPLEPGVST